MAEKVVNLSAIQASCQRCGLRQLCLPQELDSEDVEKLDNLVQRLSPLETGEYLFRQADRYKSLFAIRSGSFKTEHLNTDGTENILGFHLPGEILGLAGIGSGEYQTSAIALERATVCELPLERIDDLAKQLPSLNRQLYKILSLRITDDHEMLMVRDRSARERVASFIYSLSQRLKRRGLSEVDLMLSMSRQDIANFLGMTLETASRTIVGLEKEGMLHIERRNIQIIDKTRLRQLSSVSRDEPPSTRTGKQSANH